MKRIEYVLMVSVLLGLSACTSVDSDLGGSLIIKGNRIHRFYATTEQSEPETKVYADNQMRVLWNSGDMISIFNQNTYNSQYVFSGEDGDNAGNFSEKPTGEFHSGNPLSNIYAVYPYDKGNKINNDENTITLTLPDEQRYMEHSFGKGANTMVAVSDNDFLSFKNLGGYLQLRLYGNNVKVRSITLRGNNGEKLAGKASVSVGLGMFPTVTMDDTATGAITLGCYPPVQLGSSAEQYTDFWLVIPPVTFSAGFTITVTDENGGVFQKTTTKSLTITRSTIEWMAAIEVTPEDVTAKVVFADSNFKAYCVEHFDTDGDGEISADEAREVEEMDVNTALYDSLRGIERFTNLRILRCIGQYDGPEWYYIFPKLLTSLDLSNNTKLTELYCQNNKLTSLDLSNNTELAILQCDNNLLKSLNVTKNIALRYLDCSSNRLTTLDVSKNTSLNELVCSDNQLSSLDLSKNAVLQYLNCNNNQLTRLDVSKNTSLTQLLCSGNQLLSLDVSKNTVLQNMNCSNNQLTSLDVSNNIELRSLRCEGNPNLSEIWLHKFLTVISIYYDPQITTIKHKDISPVNYYTIDSIKSVILADINLYNNANYDVYHYSDRGYPAIWGDTFDGPIALYKKNGVRWMNMRLISQSTEDAHSFFLDYLSIPLIDGNHNVNVTIAPTRSDSLKVFNDIVNFFTAIAYFDEGAVPYLKYVNSPDETSNYRIYRIRADHIVFSEMRMKRYYGNTYSYGLTRASVYDNKAIVFADGTYSVNLDSYYDSFSNIIELFLHYIGEACLNKDLYSDEDEAYTIYSVLPFL